jgi:hypothetical protein
MPQLSSLFFSFFMGSMLSAPFAEFYKFNFPLNGLFIFSSIIINPFARRAAESY